MPVPRIPRSGGGHSFTQRPAGKSGRVRRIKPWKTKHGRLDAVEPAPPRPMDEIEADWEALQRELLQ